MIKTELCLNVRKETADLIRSLAERDQRHMRTIAADAVQLYAEKYPGKRGLNVPLKLPPGTNPKSTIIHIPPGTWSMVERFKDRDHAPRYFIMADAVALYLERYAKAREPDTTTLGRGRPPKNKKELA